MAHPMRDFIIAKKETTKEPVAFGGQTLYVKKLKAREVRDVIAWQEKGDKGIHPQVWWLIAGLCDESGVRIFEWSDAEHLNELDATDVQMLYDAINEINSANRTPEDIAKNS